MRLHSVKFFKKHNFLEGTWEIFHSDNKREFANREVEEILNRLNVRIIYGRPYHPQTRGQIERFNRSLKSRLRKYLPYNNFEWSKYIDQLVYDYNNAKHRATEI